MTNYNMSEGIKRNNRIKWIKRVVGLVLVIFALINLFKYWDKQEAEMLNIQYCWDSEGNHYVAPNEACQSNG